MMHKQRVYVNQLFGAVSFRSDYRSIFLMPKLLIISPKGLIIGSRDSAGSNNLKAQARKSKDAVEGLVALADVLKFHLLSIRKGKMNPVCFDQSGGFGVDFLNLDEL